MSFTRLFNYVVGRSKSVGFKDNDRDQDAEDAHDPNTSLVSRSESSSGASPAAASILASSQRRNSNDLTFGPSVSNPALGQLEGILDDSNHGGRDQEDGDSFLKWGQQGRTDSDSRTLAETPSGRSSFFEATNGASPDSRLSAGSPRHSSDSLSPVQTVRSSLPMPTLIVATSPKHGSPPTPSPVGLGSTPPNLPFPSVQVSNLLASNNRRKATSVNSYLSEMEPDADTEVGRVSLSSHTSPIYTSSSSSQRLPYLTAAPSPVLQRSTLAPINTESQESQSEKSEFEGRTLAHIQLGSFRSLKGLQYQSQNQSQGQGPASPIPLKSPNRPKALSVSSYSGVDGELEWDPSGSNRLHSSGVRNISGTISPMIVVQSHSNSVCSSPRNDLDGHSRQWDSFASRPVATVSSSRTVQIPEISWSNITIENPTTALLGRGTYGSVVRATYAKSDMECPGLCFEDVVVKVMIKSLHTHPLGYSSHGQNITLQSSLRSPTKASSSKSHLGGDDWSDVPRAMNATVKEASTTLIAESRMAFKDCITKVYGICDGPLPSALCQLLKVSHKAEALGIVMRHEAGGTLHSLLHPKKHVFKTSPERAFLRTPEKAVFIDTSTPTITGSDAPINVSTETEITTRVVPLLERVRLLMKIARGLAELHAAGIVHGDIKPENILLSGTTPPDIRIADFGFSTIHELAGVESDETELTHAPGGTPRYSAPEMMLNPYEEDPDDRVAAASRKTDVYAFAVMAWEVLTGEVPFADIRNSPLLGQKVHQGYRPPIDAIPKEVPNAIVGLIQSCWDGDRSKRKSALECYTILKQAYEAMSRSTDIFLLCCSEDISSYGTYLTNSLSKAGFRVVTCDGDKICQIVVPSDETPQSDGTNDCTTTNSSSGKQNDCSGKLSAIKENDSTKSSAKGSAKGSAKDGEVDTANESSKNITASIQSGSKGGKVEAGPEKQADPTVVIKECRILVVGISRALLSQPSCVQLMRRAKKASLPIVPFFLEPQFKLWATQELVYLCQLQAHSAVYFEGSRTVPRILSIASDSTATEDDVDEHVVSALKSSSDVDDVVDCNSNHEAPLTSMEEQPLDTIVVSNLITFLRNHQALQ